MISDAPPIVLTQLESLRYNKFQRNICIGRLNKDETMLVRYYCLKNELIHNMPRDALKSEQEIYVWKPDKKEKDFFFILNQFLQSNETKMVIYQELNLSDRKVAHYVAESIGIEHESNDTPEGRRMTFYKSGALKPTRSVSENTNSSDDDTMGMTGLSRSDTWHSQLSRSETWNPSISLPRIFCGSDFDDMASIAHIEELATPSSPDMSTDNSAIPPDITHISLPAQATVLDEFSIDMPLSEGHPLSRQVSRRVLDQVSDLKQKVKSPSQYERITTGTGEVYLVVDSGTGERAIFKPASQVAQSKRSSHLYDIPSISEASSSSISDDMSPQPLEFKDEQEKEESNTHRKEVAAYQLDHFGFAGVLPTMESEVKMKDDPAAGMIQQYLEHDKVADEDVIGLTEINLIPDFEVHKIGLLDIRLFNQDRHGGNLIIDQKKGTGHLARLVPIDHELTLPHWNNLENATFCWISWKQAARPFDKKTLQYINDLDIERDEYLLDSLTIPTTSIATYKICCTLLKVCACDYGMLLKDIANMMVRFPEYPYDDKFGPLADENLTHFPGVFQTEDGEDPSTLEKLLKLTLAKVSSSGEEVCLNHDEPRSPNKLKPLDQTTGDAIKPTDDVIEFGTRELVIFTNLLKEYLNTMRPACGFDLPPVVMDSSVASSGQESEQPPPPSIMDSKSTLPPPASSVSVNREDAMQQLDSTDMARRLEGQTLRKLSATHL